MNTVFLTVCNTDAQALMIQSVLESKGITSFLKNETVSQVFGNYSPFQLEIYVSESDYERAKEVIEEGFPDLSLK